MRNPTWLRKKKKTIFILGGRWARFECQEKGQIKFLLYFPIHDATINFVDERFSQLEKVKSASGFFYSMQNLVNEARENIF